MTGNRLGLAGRWFTFAVAALLLAGCPANGDDEAPDRDASVYRGVINDIVKETSVQTEDPETLPTLFIEAFDPEGIPLEVQVELVAEFEERYAVRFIDDRIEATDIELPGSPVRPESLFLGLGPAVGDDTVNVRGELYFAETDIRAYRYTLNEQADQSWSIVGSPESVDPEGFVTTS
ncbi:MAG: hypothetical protein ACN4GZ_07655 [Acidimicrobiales bacterium]